MKTEIDGGSLVSLGHALAALSPKLEGKDVVPGAEAIVARMKTEKDNLSLASLGEALGSLFSKGGNTAMLIPAVNAVIVATKTEWDPMSLRGLTHALTGLAPRLTSPILLPIYGHPVTTAQVYADLLKQPMVVGDARSVLMDGLEQTTGTKFGNNIWQFVSWATETDAGRSLNLDLENPPQWK
jgi:hypothetical protein